MRRKKITKAKRPQCPSSPLSKRFAAIMHRGEDKPWAPKWIDAFRELAPHVTESDLARVERRYRVLWPPNSAKNSLRHDLYTLINQWWVEVDRANAWCDANPEKKERKVIPMPQLDNSKAPVLTEQEISDGRRFLDQVKQRKASRK